MDTSGQTATEVAGTPKRQQRSIRQKREIVEETLAPGASVARVARAHGVNANQVFAWRRMYRQGRLGNTRQRPIPLLPVTVTENHVVEAGEVVPQVCREPVISAAAAVIDLELSKAHLRIEGHADPAMVRLLLECLLG
jgi:transposase